MIVRSVSCYSASGSTRSSFKIVHYEYEGENVYSVKIEDSDRLTGKTYSEKNFPTLESANDFINGWIGFYERQGGTVYED